MGKVPAIYGGSWKHERSENMDKFLEAMGVPWMARKMAAHVSPTVTIVQEEDHFHITTKTAIMTREEDFTIDVDNEFTAQNGVKCLMKPRWEEGKLVIYAEPLPGNDEPKRHWYRREISPDGKTLTLSIKFDEYDWIAVRVFSKVEG